MNKQAKKKAAPELRQPLIFFLISINIHLHERKSPL